MLDALRRAYLSLTRGVIMSVDDSTPIQTVSARLLPNELPSTIERVTTYGFHSVPLPPDNNGEAGAEAVVGFMHGNRSHPVVLGDIDRRTKPKNLKHGESIHHDDQKQSLYLARDGHYATAKQHVITAGDKPDTTFELNEQLKGLAARVAQAEHGLHGLFDVTSVFRQIVQQTIPDVAAVAPILNQDPSGLPLMAKAIADKEQAYLQQQVTQALEKFLAPNLSGLSSLLGAIEGNITSLVAQIEKIVGQNPVVGQVDDLLSELAGLQASGNSASVISSTGAALQAQIDALAKANPIIGQIANLRNTLQSLMSQAGDGMNFLAPQQRLVQGLSKSMKFAKTS